MDVSFRNMPVDQEVLALYAAQAGVCAMLACALHRFYWLSRRKYLLAWGWSWWALAIYNACAAIALVSVAGGVSPTVRWINSLAAQSFGFVQAAFMFYGTWELANGREIAFRKRLGYTLALLVAAIAIVVATARIEWPMRFAARVGSRSLMSAITVAYAVWVLARIDRPTARFGRTATMVTLALYALQQFDYFALILIGVVPSSTLQLPLDLGLIDLFLHSAIGLSMMIWHFEEERDRAQQAMAALRASEERVRQAQKMEVIGRLAGGIAHDFNSLLTGIVGYAELLDRAVAPSAQARGWVRGIARSAERACALTAQLLIFARRADAKPERVDLNRELARLEPMLRSLNGPDVALELALDARPATIECDPVQLEQLIYNLAINARDAMPKGGVVRITTSRATARDAEADVDPQVPAERSIVRMVVADDGEGMDERTRARAFEPFFTTKPLGGGPGLGLSTAYGVVTQARGSIALESSPGGGTRITIDWPSPPERTSSLAESASGGETVLLVEGQADLRTALGDHLRALGYRVLAARDGSQALGLADAHVGRISALITEIAMSGLDGVELARQVLRKHPGARVVYVASRPGDEAVLAGEPELRGARIAKPFQAQALARTLQDALDQDGARGGLSCAQRS